MQETTYALRVQVPLRYDEAVQKTTAALKEEGFGVLTTIDVKGPGRIKVTILAADASRRASLLVAYILPVCALLAPCRAGASTPRTWPPYSDRSP
jgi:hypothetical protein